MAVKEAVSAVVAITGGTQGCNNSGSGGNTVVAAAATTVARKVLMEWGEVCLPCWWATEKVIWIVWRDEKW